MKINYGTSMEIEIYKKFLEYCQKTGIKKNQFIEELIKDFFKRNETKVNPSHPELNKR